MLTLPKFNYKKAVKKHSNDFNYLKPSPVNNKKYERAHTEEVDINFTAEDKSLLNEIMNKRDNILYSDFKLREITKMPIILKKPIYNRALVYQDHPHIQNIRILRERMSVINDFYRKKKEITRMTRGAAEHDQLVGFVNLVKEIIIFT
jgi:hypothetical protein